VRPETPVYSMDGACGWGNKSSVSRVIGSVGIEKDLVANGSRASGNGSNPHSYPLFLSRYVRCSGMREEAIMSTALVSSETIVCVGK
jgi:hypothetical protein